MLELESTKTARVRGCDSFRTWTEVGPRSIQINTPATMVRRPMNRKVQGVCVWRPSRISCHRTHPPSRAQQTTRIPMLQGVSHSKCWLVSTSDVGMIRYSPRCRMLARRAEGGLIPREAGLSGSRIASSRPRPPFPIRPRKRRRRRAAITSKVGCR